MKRKKCEALETKEKILRTALEVFSKKGYDRTTIEDVAEESGLSRGAVYWHFNNKITLFISLYEEFGTNLIGNVEFEKYENKEMTFSEKINHIIIDYFEKLESNKQFAMLEEIRIKMFCIEDRDIKEYLNEKIEDENFVINNNSKVIKLINDAKNNGELNREIDSIDFYNIFISLINGIELIWFMNRKSYSVLRKSEDIIQELSKIIYFAR